MSLRNTLIRNALLVLLVVGLPLLVARRPQAYESYREDVAQSREYCIVCHSGFEGRGTLHRDHENFGTNNCRLCHTGSGRGNPLTMWAEGDADDGLGCAGCHGRDYGETIQGDYSAPVPITGLPKMSGYGLHRWHAPFGGTDCTNCHATPRQCDVQLERVLPGYYGRGDVVPTDSCMDGLDNDGDTFRDMTDPDCLGCDDRDNDGWGDPGSANCPSGTDDDCDDCDPNVNPGAVEICDNGIDDDCDFAIDCDDTDCQVDADGDTQIAEPCGPDCDDNDGDITGVEPETLCSDAKDNDCDTLTDLDDPDCQGGPDADGDGVPDSLDNCPRIWNPNQQADACDPDWEVKPIMLARGGPEARDVILTWPKTPPDPLGNEYSFYTVYLGSLDILSFGTPASPMWNHSFITNSCTPSPIRQFTNPDVVGVDRRTYYLVVGWEASGEGAYGWADVDPLGGGPGTEDAPREPNHSPPTCP